MEAQELKRSLQQLNDLARDEYRSSLAEIVACAGDSEETRLLRLGRLLGVTLKQPFARSRDLAAPSGRTRVLCRYGLLISSSAAPECSHHELSLMESELRGLVPAAGFEPATP